MTAVVEIHALFWRALREIPRLPMRIVLPLLIPVVQLVLLAAVFKRLALLPGYPTSSLDFLAAGNAALAVALGAGGAGFQMVMDIDSGFFDKLRVAPIRRASILVGLLATDAVRLALHAMVVTLVALALGARLATGVPGLLMLMLLGGVFGAAWSGISLNAALRTRSFEVTAAANVVAIPFYMGSTAFMPKSLLPHWLQVANDYNPLAYLVDAMRVLMLDGWRWTVIGEGFAAAAAVGAATLPLALVAFRRSLRE